MTTTSTTRIASTIKAPTLQYQSVGLRIVSIDSNRKYAICARQGLIGRTEYILYKDVLPLPEGVEFCHRDLENASFTANLYIAYDRRGKERDRLEVRDVNSDSISLPDRPRQRKPIITANRKHRTHDAITY